MHETTWYILNELFSQTKKCKRTIIINLFSFFLVYCRIILSHPINCTYHRVTNIGISNKINCCTRWQPLYPLKEEQLWECICMGLSSHANKTLSLQITIRNSTLITSKSSPLFYCRFSSYRISVTYIIKYEVQFIEYAFVYKAIGDFVAFSSISWSINSFFIEKVNLYSLKLLKTPDKTNL